MCEDLQDYIESNDNFETISIGHRIAIKTSAKIIKNLFFQEYIEPILVVKNNRKIKKYDIKTSLLIINTLNQQEIS